MTTAFPRALACPRLWAAAIPVAASALAQAQPAPLVPGATPPAASSTPAPPAARALTPMPVASAAPTPTFAIQGFRLLGANPLGEAQAQAVLAPFVRPGADLQSLQSAVAALEQALRSAGFDLYQVVLPPQEIGGTVALEIVPVTLGSVRVEGQTLRSEQRIRQSLPELREGHSPSLGRVAVQASIANLDPNRRVDVAFAESDQPAQVDAVVRVIEMPPLTFSVTLSNAGSAATGRDRATFAVAHTDLFERDHQLAAAYTTSLERPRDVRQFGVAYSVPLYARQAVASASFTRSDVVGQFGAFTSTGAGHALQLAYTLHLLPRQDRRSEVTLGLDDRFYRAADINGVPIGGDRRAVPLRLRYATGMRGVGTAWRASLELAVNTGWGRSNTLQAYRAEYAGIDTVRWKALRGEAEYSAALENDWTWTARTSYQYSPDALIAGEQFGLGGPGSIRGTRHERPLAGDMGMATTLEVATPPFGPGLRMLGFVDAGWVANNDADGLQRQRSDRIASAGLGLRYLAGGISASAEYGQVLLGSRVPQALNPFAPREGEGRLYLQATVRF